MGQRIHGVPVELRRCLRDGTVRRTTDGLARVTGAQELAREHLAVAHLAVNRGTGIAALGSAVSAARSALVGIAGACGYEVVATESVPDSVPDGALGAVVRAERQTLVPLMAGFESAIWHMEAAGITEPMDEGHTRAAIDVATALIAALVAEGDRREARDHA